METPRHGQITSDYIDYNRRDVRASQELFEKLRAEFDRHPVDLLPTRASSPASISKAYLRALGVTPGSLEAVLTAGLCLDQLHELIIRHLAAEELDDRVPVSLRPRDRTAIGRIPGLRNRRCLDALGGLTSATFQRPLRLLGSAASFSVPTMRVL